MQIFRELAGYSFGRADIVRRAMAKKKHSVMESERKVFIYGTGDADDSEQESGTNVEGCVKRGVPEEIAEKIFNEMSSFASYAFNKAHATSYALVAYQTAWLKCHYPKEYMAALLTSVLDGSGKVAAYIAECERLGIPVLPPSVNESGMGFTVSEEGIRFGLLAVKNLGRGLIAELVREREEEGKYQSFVSFCSRLSTRREFNARALDSLIRCGALDGLGANRRQMLGALEDTLNGLEEKNRRNLAGQVGFFDSSETGEVESEAPLPTMPEFSYAEMLAMEKETTGLYISGHPLAPYTGLYDRIRAAHTDQILSSLEDRTGEYKDGDEATLLGMVSSVKQKITKSNAAMAYVTLEDIYGSMELLIFPRLWAAESKRLTPGAVVVVKGRISAREDETPKLLADSVEQAPEPGNPSAKKESKMQNNANIESANIASAVSADTVSSDAKKTAGHPGLYLRVSSPDGADYKRACLITAVFEGTLPLFFRFTETGKMMRAPQNMFVWPNEVMLGELRRVLGDENVAYID